MTNPYMYIAASGLDYVLLIITFLIALFISVFFIAEVLRGEGLSMSTRQQRKERGV